jgi:glycosyltransferase involved in cell wall biosynthesis
MSENRVAIVSDVVMEYGGAEKVLGAIMEMYPRATLYTLFIVPTALRNIKMKFPEIVVKTSPFQIFVTSNKVSRFMSVIKLFSWTYWEKLDLSKNDLVISSSHSYGSKAVRTNCFHLSYVHTPPRYLYDEFSELGFFKMAIFWPVRKWLMGIDQNGAMQPDVMVANSINIRNRIKKYYGRDSIVVYPPIDEVRVGRGVNPNYYIWISRLVKQKGVELAIEACQNLGVKLIVVGDGDERRRLEKKFHQVTFVGKVDDRQKLKLLEGAKALLYTSIDEDFGIVPIEALKKGIPVIAFKSGGTKETVVDGKNGVLFDDYSVLGLVNAIKRFEKMEFNRFECVKSVEKFSKQIFKNKISDIIKKYAGKN